MSTPLLARVRRELVSANLFGQVDLTDLPACTELLEITRDTDATVLLHRPGRPLSSDDFASLTRFLDGTGVVLTRQTLAVRDA